VADAVLDPTFQAENTHADFPQRRRA
jgi:hypothetical protein